MTPGHWPEGGCLFIWDQAEAISVSSAYSLTGVASREGSQEGPVNRSSIVHYPEMEFLVSCIACASGSAQINGMVRANLITVALPALKAERREIIREPVHGKYIAVLHVIAIGIMPAEQEFIRSVTVQIQKRKRDFLQQGGGILP